jgi:hypothetical protein
MRSFSGKRWSDFVDVSVTVLLWAYRLSRGKVRVGVFDSAVSAILPKM